MKLEGKAVLVTGASRGLGEALVETFARKGARVVGVSRNADEMEAVASRLTLRASSALRVLVALRASVVQPALRVH